MYPNLPLSLVCLTLLPLPYTYACLQPSHLPGQPLNSVPACRGTPAMCLEEVTLAGFCAGAAKRKVAIARLSLAGEVLFIWWSSTGNSAMVPARALEGWGKSGVSLLCWSQHRRCQNCDPACTGVLFPLCNSGKQHTKHGRLFATHPVFCLC